MGLTTVPCLPLWKSILKKNSDRLQTTVLLEGNNVLFLVTIPGNDYKLHVKCITENEKYGGKDYVPKPTSNKGELKQEMWIEHINSTLATKKISGPLSGLLGQIVNHTNIPRKQKKFENFISNSLKIRNKRLITEAWEICAEGFKNDSNKSNNKASDAKNVKNDTSLSNGNSGSSEDSSSTKRSSDCQDDKTAKKIRLCNKENTDKSNGFDWCKASEEILQECPSGLCEKALRNQVIAKYKAFIGDSCKISKKELKTIFRNELSKNSCFHFYTDSSVKS
ncbi:UNVERIFIED_CONTAM: Lyar [Trichonephila clavipes]